MNKSIFLLLCLTFNLIALDNQSEIFSETINISLGYSCTVADMLRSNNLRCLAFPFDWIRSSFKGLYELLENDFVDFLNPTYLSFETTYILNKKYITAFHHDFPAERTNGRIEYIKENYYDFINEVSTKYKRRIDRFYQALNSGHKVNLFRISSATKPWNLDPLSQTQNEVIKLKNLLLKKFPHSHFTLVVIDNHESYKKDWGIDHIKNFYINDPMSTEEWQTIFKQLELL